MKPARRWPLHPPPVEGEALSSWLHRLAASYQMDVADLVTHGLGHNVDLLSRPHAAPAYLDFDPPETLLVNLAERTGVDLDQLHAMTLAGWVPWLFDALDAGTEAFEVYVHQFSVLLRPENKPNQPTTAWVPWISDQLVTRACPRCLADPDRAVMLLMWRLPLMLSCPEHLCLLRPYLGYAERPIWTDESQTSYAPSAAVIQMDSRTNQALTTGKVDLPRGSVHAAVWIRLLRTMINELSTQAKHWGNRAQDLRYVWVNTGRPVRAGQQRWKPFEALPWPTQGQLLEAAAVAMSLLHSGALSGRGSQASLLASPSGNQVDDGLGQAPYIATSASTEAIRKMQRAIDELVAAARQSPEEAQTLYNFCLIGCHTEEAAERLLVNFVDLQIPIDQLSHNQPGKTVRVR